MDSNMVRRVGFAAVAIPLIGLLVWNGGAPFAALIATAAVLGVREVYDLAALKGVHAFRVTGFVIAALVPIVLFMSLDSGAAAELGDRVGYLVPAFLIVLLVQALATRTAEQRPLESVAVTAFGVCYAALLPAYLLQIRMARWPTQSWAGFALVFFPFVVTWLCDTAAMLGGRAIGGAKLAPSISPGKTRAGAVAGLIGGTLAGALFAYTVFPRVGVPINVLSATALAAVLSVFGQVGDLAESLLKREAGVKDSSTLIPGHGGVLDRLDSLYFVIPVAAAGYHLLGLA